MIPPASMMIENQFDAGGNWLENVLSFRYPPAKKLHYSYWQSTLNLIASAEKASHTSSERLLYALGIDGIGAANAKLISSACDGKWARIESLTVEDLVGIDGIGEVMADAFVRYFADNAVRKSLDLLMRFLDIDESGEEKEDFFDGLTFVITGALTGYGNRGELKAAIERAGGKVSGSVSARTNYLINNNVKSNCLGTT